MKCFYTASRIALAFGLAAAQPVFAQDAASGERIEADKPQGGLDEIVVTAQKRAESSQKAAIAITAVSSEALQRAAVTDAQQLTNLAPALHVNTAFGPTNTFFIRGVGNLVFNASSDSSVALNIDGIPVARPTGTQGMFFDLERIEVLKGPQGTLYGRNATGGAINVITVQPKLGELSGFVDFSYGNYDAIKANGAVNVPIGDNTAIRIAGMRSKRDGTYSDGTGDEDLTAFRVSLASEPTDTLKVALGFDFAHQGGKGPGLTPNGLDYDQRIGILDSRAGAAVYGRSISPAPFPFGAAGFVAFPGAVLQPYNTVVGTNPFQDNKFWGVRLQADLDTPLGTVSFIPSHRRSSLDFLANAGPTALVHEKDEQTSMELRLASPSETRLQYIFGAFYFNERVASLNGFNFQYAQFASEIHPKTDSYAAYGRLTYSVTPEFRINGGLRYTIDKRSTDDSNVNQQVVCPGVFTGYAGGPATTCVGTPTLPVQFTPVNPADYVGVNGAFLSNTVQPNAGRATFKKLTWRAAVEYDAGPASLLYASVESGYKAGGFFNSPDQAHNSYRPEGIIAYTVGSKNRFLNNRLQVNLEAFWWSYTDQHVSHFVSVGGTPVFATENIGKSRIRGIELELRAQIMDNTELNGTAQYLDARNTNFLYGSSLQPNTGCASGVGGPGGAPFFIDCSGRRPANAPVWTLQGGIRQKIPLGDVGDLTLGVSTRYQSGNYTGIDLLETEFQKGFFNSSAQIEYKAPGGRYTITGFIDNIENNTTVGYSQPHNFAPGQVFATLQMPRTYGVRVGAKF